MKYKKSFVLAVLAVGILAAAQMTAIGQTPNDGKIANMAVGAGGVRWDILVAHGGGTLTVTFPDGRAMRKAFRAGASPEINLSDKQLEGVPDGVYSYDLQLATSLSPSQKEEMAKARGKDDDAENERMMRKRPAVPSLNQSGAFTISNGIIIGPGAVEGQRSVAKATETRPASGSASRTPVSANTISRLRNHRLSLAPMFDFVINDDLIVIGSTCTGLDCVNGEVFGFDTLRLKENNTRLQFEDTSAAGFPLNNWQIRANSSSAGGQSFLAILDQGAAGNSETGTIVFQVTAGAPANSVNVASNGKVGFRTSAPVLDLHMNTSDTPAVRFEQNNSGGFTAQTWDIGANEANFFVRDVTGGSRLSLRIRPGAPTSSLDIASSGNVGIGTAGPTSKLHVVGTGQAVAVDAGNSLDFFALQTVSSTTGLSGRVGGATLGNSTSWFGIQTNSDNNANSGFYVKGTGGSSPVLVAATNGRVGINTAAADQALSVSGDASKSVGGGSWQVFSDKRLKNINGRFTSGLSAVMQLQPIRFQYKADNALRLQSDREQVGFGAQDLQKVIPEAVTRSENGYLQVNNDPIIWTMLNAIKEQQKEIEQLKGQVRKLQSTSQRRRK